MPPHTPPSPPSPPPSVSCAQFEMHLRAVLGLPCPTPTLTVGAAMMINILGKNKEGIMKESTEIMRRALAVPGAAPHWCAQEGAAQGVHWKPGTLAPPPPPAIFSMCAGA